MFGSALDVVGAGVRCNRLALPSNCRSALPGLPCAPQQCKRRCTPPCCRLTPGRVVALVLHPLLPHNSSPIATPAPPPQARTLPSTGRPLPAASAPPCRPTPWSWAFPPWPPTPPAQCWPARQPPSAPWRGWRAQGARQGTGTAQARARRAWAGGWGQGGQCCICRGVVLRCSCARARACGAARLATGGGWGGWGAVRGAGALAGGWGAGGACGRVGRKTPQGMSQG